MKISVADALEPGRKILLAFANVVNRAPTVAPIGGAQARLTTNPLCFA